MTYEEVKQLLDSNHITYITKNDSWMYGRATVGEISNVLLMPMFDDKTKEELDYITQCMKRMQVTAQKTSEMFTDFIVGTFLDELQADPKTRTLLDETIPQYVVPKDFRFFPYENTCPARKCNESKLRAYFNHMIEMNKIKPLYKSKKTDMVLKRRLEDEIIEKQNTTLTRFELQIMHLLNYTTYTNPHLSRLETKTGHNQHRNKIQRNFHQSLRHDVRA